MTALRSRVPPLAPVTYITRLITLRGILSELAYTTQLAELGQLLRRQDIPRRPHTLPRALPAEHDQLLQQELLRRNDLGSNFFLLLRHTGMRIGEAVDLAFDCLHTSGPDQWRIHVPLGKLKTERMVPIDSFTRDLVQRLRFFRSLDPSPSDGRLLARPGSRHALIRQLRAHLYEVCTAAGLPARIVPHQLRHTYASEMLRCGVDLPALMKMLGHASPEMTMVYLDIALTDLQRESSWLAPTRCIWRLRQELRLCPPAKDSVALSSHCSPPSTLSRCTAVPSQIPPPDARWSDSSIGLPKSLRKSRNSRQPKNGQRLAG